MDDYGSLRQLLIRGTAGVSAINVAAKFLLLLVSVLLARTLGAEGYGIYGFAMSVAGLLAVPVQLGLPQAIVRYSASYLHQGNIAHIKGMLRRANQAVLAAGIAISVLGIGFVYGWVQPHGAIDPDVLIWAFVLLPILGLAAVRDSMLRGLGRVAWGQLPENIFRPVLFIGFILALLFVGDRGLQPLQAMWLQVAATFGAYFAGLWLFYKARPTNYAHATPQYDLHTWVRGALPFLFLAAVYAINERIGVVMLGLMKEAGDVGLYRVALHAGVLVAFGLAAIEVVVAPHIARLHAAQDRQRLQRLVTRAAQGALLAALPVAVVLLLYGDWLLAVIFGEEFAAGHRALQILVLGHLVNAGMGCVVVALNMTGNGWYTTLGITIAAAASVVLNWLLIPTFGIAGAATATATSLVLWNVLLAYWLYRRTGLLSLPVTWRIK